MIIAIASLVAGCLILYHYIKGILESIKERSVTKEERNSFHGSVSVWSGVVIGSFAYIFIGVDSLLLVAGGGIVVWLIVFAVRDRFIPLGGG